MATTGRKISKRACDGCKVRKIRCAGVPPCAACVAVRIPCTFHKHPLTRGPRSLRAKTTRQIAQVQGRDVQEVESHASDDRTAVDPNESSDTSGWAPMDPGRSEDVPLAVDPAPPAITAVPDSPRPASQPSPPSIGRKPTPTHSLVLSLCIYRLRLFPVWPIIAVEEIMAALHRDCDDLESYALANAVGAATMAQLKLDRVQDGDSATAGSMESECRRTQRLLQIRHGQVPPMNLNALRISFFLHVYHENNAPGGPRSLLYLREAITIAQLLGLHKQATYLPLPPREQQMMQRILWLLFVTERGVAMLHQLPVILRCNIKFLNLDDADDEAHVLPAFRRLVNLFWLFDQSGVFNLQDMDDMIREPDGTPDPLNRNILDLLQRQLREVPLASEFKNEVQTADIYVTRQWMQAILWRASINRGRRPPASEQSTSLSHPIHIAREFLETISRVPSTAVEAHGPAMEYKIYEIARAVSDSVLCNILVPRDTLDRPREILTQLQLKLASCRGGNKALLSLLRSRIAQIQDGEGMPMNTRPGSRVEEIVDDNDVQTSGQPSMHMEEDMDRSCQPSNPSAMSLPMDQQGYDSQNPYQAGLSDMTPWNQGMSPGTVPSTYDLFNELQAFGGSLTDVESAGILNLLSVNGSTSEVAGNWDWSGGGPLGMGYSQPL